MRLSFTRVTRWRKGSWVQLVERISGITVDWIGLDLSKSRSG